MTTEVNYLPNSGTLTADTKIDYIYDNTGLAFVMVEVYNSDNNYYVSTGKYTFYVKRNAQGDVTSLIDITSGNTGDSIDYIYTAYGRHYIEGISGDISTMIADLNTVTYKGYSYDSDLEMYYLGSRWYDPEVCRFISGDSYVSTGQDITGFNMFAYCGNNPINRADPSGMFWKEIGGWFKNIWSNVKTWATNTFGAGSSVVATISKTEIEYLSDPLPITAKSGVKTTQTISEHGDSSKPLSVYAKGDATNPVKSSSVGAKVNISNFTLDISLGLDNIGIYGSLANGNTTNGFGLRVNLSELKVGFEGFSSIKWDNITETSYSNVSISGWFILASCMFLTTGQLMSSPSNAY